MSNTTQQLEELFDNYKVCAAQHKQVQASYEIERQKLMASRALLDKANDAIKSAVSKGKGE